MSKKELDILIQRKDYDGNIEVHYPITKAKNIKNLKERVNKIVAESGEYVPVSTKGTAGGVAALDDAGKVPATQLPSMDYDPSGSAAVVQSNLDTHKSDKANPHAVTASQVGAIPTSSKGTAGGVAELGTDGKVPSSQLPEMDYDVKGSAALVQTNLNTHTGNKANPHEVTKAQVGLGNVDNTSDANKPVSTAQKTAIDAVGAKADNAMTAAQNAQTAADKAQESADNAVKSFGKKLIATFTSSGMFTLATYGLSIGDKIGFYIVGGGGGGSSGYIQNTGYGGGGGGGYCKLVSDFTLAAASYAITVGAGGTGATGTTNGAITAGGNGGSSSAFGTTATGGSGAPNTGAGGAGGSGGGGTHTTGNKGGDGGSGGGDGGVGSRATQGGNGGGNTSYQPVNPYDGIAYGCGGGGYPEGMGGGAGGKTPGRGGGGVHHTYNVAASNGGSGGGGGGGNSINYKAGNGGSGIVLIYAAV